MKTVIFDETLVFSKTIGIHTSTTVSGPLCMIHFHDHKIELNVPRVEISILLSTKNMTFMRI